MAETLLIALAGFTGMIFSIKSKGIFQKIITSGLFISILLTLSNNNNLLISVVFAQFLLAILTTIYGITKKNITLKNRLSIASIGMLLTIGNIFIIAHYPYQNILRLSLLLPLIVFIITTIENKNKQPKEFGFMLIWAVIAIIKLIKFII